MWRRTVVAVACAAALATPLGAVEILQVAAAEAPLRLIAPGPDHPLFAGESVLLQWTPIAYRALPAVDFREWEAFLSVDGGASYPIRLTPHLASDLHSVRVQIPNVPTQAGRLMIRIGNERRELAIVAPDVLEIRPARQYLPTLPTQFVWQRGERARAEDLGVLWWHSGSRRGTARREVTTLALNLRLGAVAPTPRMQLDLPAAEEAGSASSPAPPVTALGSPVPALRAPSRRGRSAAPSSRELLFEIQRQNE